MALVKTQLQMQLNDAFKSAMEEFLKISAQPSGNSAKDTSAEAISAASSTFSEKASTAVDSYIRSQTIIIPPGQLVATAGTPAAQTGATVAPSPSALIS